MKKSSKWIKVTDKWYHSCCRVIFTKTGIETNFSNLISCTAYFITEQHSLKQVLKT